MIDYMNSQCKLIEILLEDLGMYSIHCILYIVYLYHAESPGGMEDYLATITGIEATTATY